MLEMDKTESETKRDDNTTNDIAEQLELVSNTNMVTKEELLQKFVAKYVLKNNLVTVAGQMFIEYKKYLDKSNQVVKRYEDFFVDIKFKHDILDKNFWDTVKDTCSGKDVVYENISINRFIKVLKKYKREKQSNKYLLWKRVSIILYYSSYVQDIHLCCTVIDILLLLLYR